jgi:phosphotransferase family enzyme
MRMSKHVTGEVLRDGLVEHAAVQAWSRLQPDQAEPEAIEVLKLERKSAVYRLIGAGPDRSAVIAKKCLRDTAMVERLIYQECLPSQPVTTPLCYGFVEENQDYCWLFLEDASGQKYSPQNPDHRIFAARWLGTVHTSEISAAIARRLPDRGPGHYLQLLRSSRTMAMRHRNNRELPPDDLHTLRTVASQLDFLESRWTEMERFCSTIPRSLVHGDFAVKNVGLRNGPTNTALLVFDWENSGWGVPAVDLCQFNGHTLTPDLETYAATREQRGRLLEFWKIERLAQYGSIFRLLEDIWWKAPGLAYEGYRYLANPIASLAVYSKRMAESLKAMEWDPVN